MVAGTHDLGLHTAPLNADGAIVEGLVSDLSKRVPAIHSSQAKHSGVHIASDMMCSHVHLRFHLIVDRHWL